MQRLRTRVGWLQCCQEKKKGGNNLIHPKDVVSALLVKWIIKTLEPGQSNLQAMLRYWLTQS